MKAGRGMLAAALVFASGVVSAAVDVDALLQESAMWLDAASLDNFVFTETGGVTNWINRSTAGRAAYGDASAYALANNRIHYGGVAFNRGVPAYQMFGTGTYIDLAYTRMTNIRAVFIVGEFVVNNALAPILGDSKACHFHRGSAGQYWNRGWSDDGDGLSFNPTFYKNSATVTCDGQNTAPSTDRFDILTVTADKGLASNQLSRDRVTAGRASGRALSEVILFERALTDEERIAIYDYLDAKWNNGGWNADGKWNVFAEQGGPNISAPTDTTFGTADDAPAVIPVDTFDIAAGATATFAAPIYGGKLAVTGGGNLVFANGVRYTGTYAQTGGTLDLGGGVMSFAANPELGGSVTWRNGTFLPNYWGEFRPAAGTTLTLGAGAVVKKDCYWRTFIDRGNVTLNLDEGSFMDVPGPFNVTIDNGTENWLNLNGGTLVVTNTTADTSTAHNQAVTILAQPATTGGSAETKKAHFTITGGRLLAGKLRVAAGWGSTGGGTIVGSAYVNVDGGAIDLLDRIEVGTTSGTHGAADLAFNGGTVTAPNGLAVWGNGDAAYQITLNGTVFHVANDCASFFTFTGDDGSLTTIGTGGLIFDVDADRRVALGHGLGGAGAIVKRGAGTLSLDKAATFTGGVTVEAGTLHLGNDGALGPGTLSLRAGTTLDFARARPTDATLAAGSAGTLRVTISQPGVNELIGAADALDLAAFTLEAFDGSGNPLDDAVLGVKDGMLTVTVADLYRALAYDAAADWYQLAWTQGGVAKAYPREEGASIGAEITARGASTITLSEKVFAGTLTLVNGDEETADVKLAGANVFDGSVDLRRFRGDFAAQVEIPHGVVLSTNATYSLDADANAAWSLAQPPTVDLSLGGAVRKTGAGTVEHPGVPTLPIDVQTGTLAVRVDEAESSGGARLTSSTGTGTVAKTGEGTLTITGGTWQGAFQALEGLLYLDGPFQGIQATPEVPFYVGPKGSVYIYGNQTANRLPNQPCVLVDGGTFTLSGTNPTQYEMTLTVQKGGTFVCDNTRGSEHLKFISLDIADSTFRFTGTKNAYNLNGCYIQAPAVINVTGACTFEKEEGNPNKIQASQALALNVASDATLSMGIPIMCPVNMAGGGTVQFQEGMTNSTALFTVSDGVVQNGGACPQLALGAGTTFKAVEAGALRVTTLTLPETGSVILDLSGIDFTTREGDLTILDCPSFTAAQMAKFTLIGAPGAPWQMSTTGGIRLKKLAQPKTLVWNSGDGNWTATEWNNDPEGYGMDGYHTVIFQNATNENPSATSTVTVTEDRLVADLMITANTTPYVLAGTGTVSTPGFTVTGQAGFSFEAPLSVNQGGVNYAATTAPQEIWDIRGAPGVVNVPAAAGGTALLRFTEASPRRLGGLTLGAGKTLEVRNDTVTGASLASNTGIVSGEGSKLILTAPLTQGGKHEDHLVNAPEFRGRLELANGGWLYVNAGFPNLTATEEEPVYVHGAGCVLCINGAQNQNDTKRLPDNAWVRVEDEAMFELRGVNPTIQRLSPNVVCSNATIQIASSTGSHLHLQNLELQDGARLVMQGANSAWNLQGLYHWGSLKVTVGEAWMTRDAGNPNWIYHGEPNGTEDISDTFEVAAGATLHLGAWMHKPFIKTGAGTLVLEGEVMAGETEKAFTLAEGWLLVNDLAAGTNVVDTLTIGESVGFDLREEGRAFGTVEAAPVIDGTGVVTLRTDDRALAPGDYLVRWAPESAPKCTFKLQAEASISRRLKLTRVTDGVRIDRRDFTIIFR